MKLYIVIGWGIMKMVGKQQACASWEIHGKCGTTSARWEIRGKCGTTRGQDASF